MSKEDLSKEAAAAALVERHWRPNQTGRLWVLNAATIAALLTDYRNQLAEQTGVMPKIKFGNDGSRGCDPEEVREALAATQVQVGRLSKENEMLKDAREHAWTVAKNLQARVDQLWQALNTCIEHPHGARTFDADKVNAARKVVRETTEAPTLDAARAATLAQPQEPSEWLTGCPECGMDSGCDCESGTHNPPTTPAHEPVLDSYDMGVLRELHATLENRSPSRHTALGHAFEALAAMQVRVQELERLAAQERESRVMFVARLENGGNIDMTPEQVLGLLGDCDYLAHQSVVNAALRGSQEVTEGAPADDASPTRSPTPRDR